MQKPVINKYAVSLIFSCRPIRTVSDFYSASGDIRFRNPDSDT